MKLLLTSGGLTTPEIIKTYEKLVGKKLQNIKLVTIEDAACGETGSMTWFENDKRRLAENCQSMTTLPLQSQPLAKTLKMIESADAIYCFGGNTCYLAKVLQETGLAAALPEILQGKAWIGSSAGSCVLCHKESPETAQEIFQNDPDVDDYLKIVPAVLMPHYHGDFVFSEAEILREAKHSQVPVYALSDRSALKVTGSPDHIKIEVVGEDYYLNLGDKLSHQIDHALNDATDALTSAAQTINEIFNH